MSGSLGDGYTIVQVNDRTCAFQRDGVTFAFLTKATPEESLQAEREFAYEFHKHGSDAEFEAWKRAKIGKK